MNKLLIWDIDGTLIQGNGIGRISMEKAFLDLYGISSALEKIEMAGMLDCIIIKNAFALHNIAENEKERFIKAYCLCLKNNVSKLQNPIHSPGIPELLNILSQNAGFYNVLGTGNLKESAYIKLSADNLDNFFICGGFGDHLPERWQVIQEAIVCSHNIFNITFTSTNIYVIGDTPRDVECGKKLGVKTIGTATGPYTTKDLELCGADFVFEDLSDIDEFLNIFQ